MNPELFPLLMRPKIDHTVHRKRVHPLLWRFRFSITQGKRAMSFHVDNLSEAIRDFRTKLPPKREAVMRVVVVKTTCWLGLILVCATTFGLAQTSAPVPFLPIRRKVCSRLYPAIVIPGLVPEIVNSFPFRGREEQNSLRITSLWPTTFHQTRRKPKASVETFAGNTLPPGDYNEIPIDTEDFGAVLLRLGDKVCGA
jgi:hypothetical protein